MAEMAKKIDKSMFDAMKNLMYSSNSEKTIPVGDNKFVTNGLGTNPTPEDYEIVNNFIEQASKNLNANGIKETFNNLNNIQKEILKNKVNVEMYDYIITIINNSKSWKKFMDIYNDIFKNSKESLDVIDIFIHNMAKSSINCCGVLQQFHFKSVMLPSHFMRHIIEAVVEDSILQFVDSLSQMDESVDAEDNLPESESA